MIQKPPITWVPSPNFGYPTGAHGRCGQKPIAIIHHLMEGYLAGTDSEFSNAATQKSTQFGIGKTGTIHQYVDTDNAAWGNGEFNNPDLNVPWIAKAVRDGINPNWLTISVEYEGRHSDDPSGHYHFTEEQIQAGIALDAWLCEQYAIVPSRETLNGHFQIDGVNRAFCPGPNFPFDRFIMALQAPAKPAPTVKLPSGAVLPAVHNGPILLGPVRAILEALGYTVQWDEATQQATIQDYKPVVVRVNAEVVDCGAELVGDRTLIRLRPVVEKLGATVLWDQDNLTADITSPSCNTGASAK